MYRVLAWPSAETVGHDCYRDPAATLSCPPLCATTDTIAAVTCIVPAASLGQRAILTSGAEITRSTRMLSFEVIDTHHRNPC